MLQLDERQVVEHTFEILLELAHEARDIEIGVNSVAECKVISFCQDLDAMREGPLSTNCFLESCTRSSAAVDLAIK